MKIELLFRFLLQYHCQLSVIFCQYEVHCEKLYFIPCNGSGNLFTLRNMVVHRQPVAFRLGSRYFQIIKKSLLSTIDFFKPDCFQLFVCQRDPLLAACYPGIFRTHGSALHVGGIRETGLGENKIII